MTSEDIRTQNKYKPSSREMEPGSHTVTWTVKGSGDSSVVRATDS